MRSSGGSPTAGVLSEPARGAIRDEVNDIFVSAVSAWEIATKHRLGKLPEADRLAGDIRAGIAWQGFDELPIHRRRRRTRRAVARLPPRPLRPHAHRAGAGS